MININHLICWETVSPAFVLMPHDMHPHKKCCKRCKTSPGNDIPTHQKLLDGIVTKNSRELLASKFLRSEGASLGWAGTCGPHLGSDLAQTYSGLNTGPLWMSWHQSADLLSPLGCEIGHSWICQVEARSDWDLENSGAMLTPWALLSLLDHGGSDHSSE